MYAGTGESFRNMMHKDNLTASIVKEKMSRGEYIDDFITNAIFVDILINSLEDTKHLIADGYPRTVSQSKEFENMMSFYKRNDVKIIYIEVSKEESIKRNILRGRGDDTEEGLNKRYDEYVNKVLPAMNYFKDKSNYKIYEINGEQSVEDVHKDIIKALGY